MALSKRRPTDRWYCEARAANFEKMKNKKDEKTFEPSLRERGKHRRMICDVPPQKKNFRARWKVQWGIIFTSMDGEI